MDPIIVGLGHVSQQPMRRSTKADCGRLHRRRCWRGPGWRSDGWPMRTGGTGDGTEQ